MNLFIDRYVFSRDDSLHTRDIPYMTLGKYNCHFIKKTNGPAKGGIIDDDGGQPWWVHNTGTADFFNV